MAGWTEEDLARAAGELTMQQQHEVLAFGVGGEHRCKGVAASRIWFARDGDLLLRDASLEVPARSMVAVLGGPGNGATALLEMACLHATSGHAAGTVTTNGAPLTAEHASRIGERARARCRHAVDRSEHALTCRASLACRAGFVPSAEVHMANLTVREALLFSARQRLPQALPDSVKRFKAEVVGRMLGEWLPRAGRARARRR